MFGTCFSKEKNRCSALFFAVFGTVFSMKKMFGTVFLIKKMELGIVFSMKKLCSELFSSCSELFFL